MVELKPGMTVWDRHGNARIVEREVNGHVYCEPARGLALVPARVDVSPLDPASPAGQGQAALEQAAAIEGIYSATLGVEGVWFAMLRRTGLDGGGWRATVQEAEAIGATPQLAAAALRDQLEAAVVAAWEREHA